MPSRLRERLLGLRRFDEVLAAAALVLMALIPLIEIALRPLLGRGVENGAVVVQHLGLVLAMFGAMAAERNGHLTSLAGGFSASADAGLQSALRSFACASAALVCGVLTQASARIVASEMTAAHVLAYGIPVWWVEASMPAGFLLLAMKLGARCGTAAWLRAVCAIALPLAGIGLASHFEGCAPALWPALIWLVAALLAGAPIFAVLGGLALALFWNAGQPLASIPLSHYQITVNPSLPALPLFTLAGLVFARTGAARRLGTLFVALFGGGVTGTVIAAALLCSFFTAFTGGSGVTILALGGLLLPLLREAGYAERRGRLGHQCERVGRAAGAIGSADHVCRDRPHADQGHVSGRCVAGAGDGGMPALLRRLSQARPARRRPGTGSGGQAGPLRGGHRRLGREMGNPGALGRHRLAGGRPGNPDRESRADRRLRHRDPGRRPSRTRSALAGQMPVGLRPGDRRGHADPRHGPGA